MSMLVESKSIWAFFLKSHLNHLALQFKSAQINSKISPEIQFYIYAKFLKFSETNVKNIICNVKYGNTGCGVFKQGVQK
jgi:hypothetical protein